MTLYNLGVGWVLHQVKHNVLCRTVFEIPHAYAQGTLPDWDDASDINQG